MNVGGFGLSRSLVLGFASVIIVISAAPTADAQDGDHHWPPKLFKNGLPKLEAPKPISFPKLGLFRNAEPDYTSGSLSNRFDGFPRLIPERDPNRPGFFQDMNTKSREMFSRTTEWASRANANARNKTFETWDNITRGMKKPKSNIFNKSANQPPVRSAQILGRNPKDKF